MLVPRSYWKAIAYVEDGTLKAKAYVLTQDDLRVQLESLGLEPFNLYQVTFAKLSERTRLSFGPLAAADTAVAAGPEGVAGAEGGVDPEVRQIESSAEIVVG